MAGDGEVKRPSEASEPDSAQRPRVESEQTNNRAASKGRLGTFAVFEYERGAIAAATQVSGGVVEVRGLKVLGFL